MDSLLFRSRKTKQNNVNNVGHTAGSRDIIISGDNQFIFIEIASSSSGDHDDDDTRRIEWNEYAVEEAIFNLLQMCCAV